MKAEDNWLILMCAFGLLAILENLLFGRPTLGPIFGFVAGFMACFIWPGRSWPATIARSLGLYFVLALPIRLLVALAMGTLVLSTT